MGSETSGTEARYHLRASSQHLVMIFNLGDRRKRYFDDLAARTLHLDTRSGQSLCGFHAPNNAANATAVECDDLNVVFPIKRLECRKCFCDFHSYSLPSERMASRRINSSKSIRFCTQAGRMSIRGAESRNHRPLSARLTFRGGSRATLSQFISRAIFESGKGVKINQQY